jgi:hypothetical protein
MSKKSPCVLNFLGVNLVISVWSCPETAYFVHVKKPLKIYLSFNRNCQFSYRNNYICLTPIRFMSINSTGSVPLRHHTSNFLVHIWGISQPGGHLFWLKYFVGSSRIFLEDTVNYMTVCPLHILSNSCLKVTDLSNNIRRYLMLGAERSVA